MSKKPGIDGKAAGELARVRARVAELEAAVAMQHGIGAGRTASTTPPVAGLEHFQQLLAALPDGVIIYCDGRVLYANPAAAAMFGAEGPTELVGKEILDLVHPDSKARIKRAIDYALAFGRHRSRPLAMREQKGLRLDGQTVYIEATGVTFDYQGRMAIQAVLRDITARKQAEEHLQRSHEQLREMVEERTAELQRSNRLLQLHSICDQALVRAVEEVELTNEICRAIVKVGGYRVAWVGLAENDPAHTVRPVAFCGLPEEAGPPRPVSWGRDQFGRGPTGLAIRNGRPLIMTDRHAAANTACWRDLAACFGVTSAISLPLKNAERTFGALTIYATEPAAFSTEQVAVLCELADDLAYGMMSLRVRRQLDAAQERLRQVINSAPVIIWAIDINGIYTVADGRLQPLGLKSEDLLGTSFYERHADRPDILEQVRLAMAGEDIVAEVHKSGRDYECRYTPLRDPADRITGVLCVATDLSERKRMEHEVLEASQREQRRIGQDLHDTIQGDLVGIGYMLSGLERDVAAWPEKGPRLATEVGAIAGMIREVIDRTRHLARGLAPVELSADGLMLALEHLAATVSNLFGANCRFHCHRRILVHDETVATQLYQICHEAVTNAIKHAAAGSITIRLTGRHNELRLSVTDDGVGLPAGPLRTRGIGLKTMTYRAQLIGASLLIGRRTDGPGTLVDCTLRSPAIKVPPRK